MKTWKRVLSLMLAIVLVVTGIQFGGIVSKAENVTYTDVSTTYSGFSGGSTSEYRVKFNTSAVLPSSGCVTQFFTGLTIETNLVNANGANISSQAQVWRNGDQQITLILWGSRQEYTKDGDTITLRASYGVHAQDASVGIQITNDITLVYNGTTASWEVKVDYTEMPITGFETPTYNETNSFWLVNLTTSGTFPKEGIYLGATIEVNGTALTSAYISSNKTYVMLVLDGLTESTLADGTTITLKEGNASHQTEQTVGITIPNRYTVVYDADTDTWTAAEYIDMNFTGIDWTGTNQCWRVRLKTSTAIPLTDGKFYIGLTATTTLTGYSSTQVFWQNGASTNTLTYILWGSGTTANDGDTITVKAGYALHETDKTKGIHITDDYTIVYDAETNSWSPYVHTEYSDITATNLHSTSWYTEGGSQHWRLYAKVSGSFPTSDTSTAYYSVPVYLNGAVSDVAGEKTSDAQVYKSDNNLGLLLWNYKVADPEVGTTITVKAGKYKDKGDATIGINITEDINFKWDGSEWYLVVTPEESAEFALDTTYNNGGDATSIYLTSTDSREVTGNSVNITAVKSETYSGVLYNGEETTAYLRKILKSDGESCYWVLLGDAGIKAVKGDLVTLQGIFSYNNYAVDYEPLTLLYDGTEWHTCYISTPVHSGQSDIDFTTLDAKGNNFIDPLAYDEDWNVSYYFVQGGLYYNGDLIVGNNNRLVKLTSTRYYASTNIATTYAGDKVVLDGIILSSDDRVAVKFDRTTFVKGEDSKWAITDSTVYDKSVSLTVNAERSSVDSTNVNLVIESSKGVLGEPDVATWSGLSVLATNESGTVTNLGELEM